MHSKGNDSKLLPFYVTDMRILYEKIYLTFEHAQNSSSIYAMEIENYINFEKKNTPFFF